MNRVIIEELEGVTRIQVNYTQEKSINILVTIFILLPAAIAVPILWYDIATNIEMAPREFPVIIIFIACTAGGLLEWWFWSNHQQMMSVTSQDGILEIVHGYKFLRFPRRYRLGDIFDIMKDAKRTEIPGDKYFLRMQCKGGQLIKITRPSIFFTKDDVERIYDALRSHIPLPVPSQRLAYFPHITVGETGSQTIVTFRTRLHFITVRYYGILGTMVAFLAFPFVLTISLGPEVFPSMLLYPGTAMMGLVILLFLPLVLPMRKKHLTHNRNTATLRINNDRPTIAVHNSVRGVDHDYPSIQVADIKSVPSSIDSELTFARHGTTEYTSYYTIALEAGTAARIFLYTTENEAEAMFVKDFLDSLVEGAKK